MDYTLSNENFDCPIEKIQNIKELNSNVHSSYLNEENNVFNWKNKNQIHKNKCKNLNKKEKKKNFEKIKKVKEKKIKNIKFHHDNLNDIKVSNNISREVEIKDNIKSINFQDLLKNDNTNISLNKNLYNKYKVNNNLNQNQFSNINKNMVTSNYEINSNMNMNVNINNINNIYNNLKFLKNNEENFGIKKKSKKNNNNNISSFPQNLSINGKNYKDLNLIDYKGQNPEMYINQPFNFENSFGIFQNNNNYFNIKIVNKNRTNLNYNLIDLSIDNFNSIQKKNCDSEIVQNDNNQSLLLNIQNQTNYYNISLSYFVEKNINKNNYLEKSKDKKFIFMSDVLRYPPVKINQKCNTPYIMNNSNKKKEIDDIILIIKIKISKEEDIEIPIQNNYNNIFLLNSIFEEKGLDRNLIYIVNKEIENVLNLIGNFSHFIISEKSNQNINDVYGFIHNKY